MNRHGAIDLMNIFFSFRTFPHPYSDSFHMHRLHICVKNSYVDFEHFNFLPVRAKKHLEMVKYITERDLDRGHL